jgi:hypothetical protein
MSLRRPKGAIAGDLTGSPIRKSRQLHLEGQPAGMKATPDKTGMRFNLRQSRDAKSSLSARQNPAGRRRVARLNPGVRMSPGAKMNPAVKPGHDSELRPSLRRKPDPKPASLRRGKTTGAGGAMNRP